MDYSLFGVQTNLMEPSLRATIWSGIIHKTLDWWRRNNIFLRYFSYLSSNDSSSFNLKKNTNKSDYVFSIVYNIQNVIGKLSLRSQIIREGQHSNIPIFSLASLSILSNILSPRESQTCNRNIYGPLIEMITEEL